MELQNDEKMNDLIERKIGNEIDGSIISDLFKGYLFKITGGFDKDGFAMKNGILTTGRKRIMLKKGSSMFRFRKGFHRAGVRKRKLVRGCMVSPDIKILNLKVTKIGPNAIPGLTEDPLPKRLGPKRANNILKEFGLYESYNKKKDSTDDKRGLQSMITSFANKRSVTTKNGKTYVKRPKVQRLITPERLRRKRVIKQIKQERRETTVTLKKQYADTVKQLRSLKKSNKTVAKKH